MNAGTVLDKIPRLPLIKIKMTNIAAQRPNNMIAIVPVAQARLNHVQPAYMFQNHCHPVVGLSNNMQPSET